NVSLVLGHWTFGWYLPFASWDCAAFRYAERAARPLETPRLADGSGAWPEPALFSSAGSAGRAADRVADAGERLVGVRAQRGDRRDAHHDDQRQHDRVFNGRRAVFASQEILDAFHEFPHDLSPLSLEKTSSGRIR